MRDWLEGCPAGCGELGCEPGRSPPCNVPHRPGLRAAGSLPGAGRGALTSTSPARESRNRNPTAILPMRFAVFERPENSTLAAALHVLHPLLQLPRLPLRAKPTPATRPTGGLSGIRRALPSLPFRF